MASHPPASTAVRSTSTNYWSSSPEPPAAGPSRVPSTGIVRSILRRPSAPRASPGPIASTSALPTPSRYRRTRFLDPELAVDPPVGRSPVRADAARSTMETIDLTDSSPPSNTRALPSASALVPAGPYWNNDGTLIPLQLQPLPQSQMQAQVQATNAIASGSGTRGRRTGGARVVREVITLSSDDSEDDVQVMENQENARRARMNLLPLGPPAARGAAYDARRPRYQTELEREVRIAGRQESIVNSVYSAIGRFASQTASDIARHLTAREAIAEEEDREDHLFAQAAAAAGGAGGWNQAANNANRGLGPRGGRGRGGDAGGGGGNRAGGGRQVWNDNLLYDRNARDFPLEALQGYGNTEYLRHLQHVQMISLFGPGGGGAGGGGGGGGLQGLMQSGVKVTKAKKYGVRLSHPRKLEEGFTRSINPPPELRDTPPPSPPHSKSKRNKGIPPVPVETEAICGSCLEPLLLAQNGETRPWALRCGHVVCGNCVGEAKMRCEEMKELERKSRWKMEEATSRVKKVAKNVQRVNGRVVVTTDSEDDLLVPSAFGPTRSRTTSTKPSPSPYPLPSTQKGKGKSLAAETGVEENWTMCPVLGCDGNGTDLLAKEGKLTGAFELFV